MFCLRAFVVRGGRRARLRNDRWNLHVYARLCLNVPFVPRRAIKSLSCCSCSVNISARCCRWRCSSCNSSCVVNVRGSALDEDLDGSAKYPGVSASRSVAGVVGSNDDGRIVSGGSVVACDVGDVGCSVGGSVDGGEGDDVCVVGEDGRGGGG
jgi:hypothetical protein